MLRFEISNKESKMIRKINFFLPDLSNHSPEEVWPLVAAGSNEKSSL